MDENDELIPLRSWTETLTSTFPPEQGVGVVDPCSPFYLQAGFVDHIDTDTTIVYVKMPGVRELVEFRPSELRRIR